MQQISANDELLTLSRKLGALLKAKKLLLATAESCTGGWLSQVITAISGSSNWFDVGLVTYSNHAKQQLLYVPNALIEKDGAVSDAVVKAMVQGLFAQSQADIGVAISGIAGPLGGNEEKPVGTVWLAWGRRDESIYTCCNYFTGDRSHVRYQTVRTSLHLLMAVLANH